MSYMKADGMEVYCIMVRKGWVTPKAMVEEFEANEYVAACWYISCDYGEIGMNDPIGRLYHTANPDGTGCGHAKNQVIREKDDGTFTMREEDGFGEDYDLRMTTDSTYQGLSDSLANVYLGETLYWISTSRDGSSTWYHKGTVESSSNVNRS